MKHRLDSKAVVGVIGVLLALTAGPVPVSAKMVSDPNNPSKVAPEVCFTFKDDRSNGHLTRIYNDCRAEASLRFCSADPKSRVRCPSFEELVVIDGNSSVVVADIGDESKVRYFGCEQPYGPRMTGHMKGVCSAVYDEKETVKRETDTNEHQAVAQAQQTPPRPTLTAAEHQEQCDAAHKVMNHKLKGALNGRAGVIFTNSKLEFGEAREKRCSATACSVSIL